LFHFPDQAPFGLTILPVPPDIISWLTCLLVSQPLKEPWLKEPMQSSFTLGLGSNVTLHPLNSPLIPTLMASPSSKRQKYSEPLLTPSEKVDLVMESLVLQSSQIQSNPPWMAFHRPLSWLTNQTQGWTEMGNLHCFYNDNSKDIRP
jgi:hypothetical protein